MSLDNQRHLSQKETKRFLIFLQTHLINIDLLTNSNFRESQKLSTKQAFDHICELNKEFYKEYDELFYFTKDQMLKFVYEHAGIDVPETLYKNKKMF
jgi:hypothetical protein